MHTAHDKAKGVAKIKFLLQIFQWEEGIWEVSQWLQLFIESIVIEPIFKKYHWRCFQESVILQRDGIYIVHSSYKTFYPFHNKHQIHQHIQSVKMLRTFEKIKT